MHISHNLKHESKEIVFTSNYGRVSAQVRIYSLEVARTIFFYVKIFTFQIRPAFHFEKPSSQEIFRIIVIDDAWYEETRPLKSVRRNKVYTIHNHTLESIRYYDNGAHVSSKQNKSTFHADVSNHNTITVRTCHKKHGIFHYKEKIGQTFTQLKRTIYRFTSRKWKNVVIPKKTHMTAQGNKEKTEHIIRKRLDRDIPNVPLMKRTSLNLKITIGRIRPLLNWKERFKESKMFRNLSMRLIYV